MEVEQVKPQGLTIFCPLCGSKFQPSETKTNMCIQCISASGNISQGITKEAIINQCRNCRRYQRPPWVYAQRESKELLALCLKKIRGLNNVKIVDAGFLYTEPHCRRIKVKLTVQKEISKNVEVQESFVVEFTEHFQQCEDCQKEFTPHTWGSVVQLRQHAVHKKTLFFVEQLILKHNAHEKCVKVQEEENGMDFFFKTRQHAHHLVDFLENLIPLQQKQSKQLLSTDEQNGTCVYKFSYSLTIPKVSKDDLVIIPDKIRKQIGSASNILVCLKIQQSLKFLCPISFNIYELQYKKYFELEKDFTILPFFSYKTEFMILNTEVDQKKRDQNTSAQTLSHKSVNVDINRVSDWQQLQVRSHLGEILRNGETWYGFDLSRMTLDDAYNDKVNLEVILIRKKREGNKRMWKLKRMDIEKLEKKKQKGKAINDQQDEGFEEFMEQLDADKDLRNQVNMYKDDKVIEEKKKEALLKKIDYRDKKIQEQNKKIKAKQQFEELKQQSSLKKISAEEEDWEDEDGIRLNDLINDLKLDDEENNDNVDQRQVEDFLQELDKIKIQK